MTNSNSFGRPKVAVPVDDGFYAASDPHQPSITTFWYVDSGELRTYPFGGGVRQAPLPPKLPAASRAERAELRDEWYRETYWPWKAAVADAIAADPAGAARRFADRYPDAMLPQTAAAARRGRAAEEERRRRFEAVWAASAARRGVPVARIARRLACAWATARVRVAEGELLLTVEPDQARTAVAEYVQGLLEPDHAERMAAAILDGQMVDVTDLVAARLPDGLSVAPASQPADMLARLADRLHKEGSGT
jgi:hypothetical protein